MYSEDTRQTGSDRDLIDRCYDLDGRNYGAYKSLRGDYDYQDFTLHIDRVQSDPYAPPSALRITADPRQLGIPAHLLDSKAKQIAVADFLARLFHQAVKQTPELSIARCGQEILERSYAHATAKTIELRFQCQFPARGRTILGRAMAQLMDVEIPYTAQDTLDFTSPEAPLAQLQEHVETYLDYLALQQALKENNWVSFIADGAILPRRSGISDLPLTDAIAFSSPASLRATVELPYVGSVSGMALKPGVTLIVGGGFHGKSTLLNAIQRAVYPHVPADGRQLVATRPQAMKVRAADGRAVTKVDISPFITNLPGGARTTQFSTENASGSTSQAAAIMEALEGGADTLLIDEDTSATNLMIRDARMRQLVAKEKEPITPLVDRIRSLAAADVSTILVMGGSGDYLDVADTVLLMDEYQCKDVTVQAHEIARELPRDRFDATEFPRFLQRYPQPLASPKGKSKTRSRGLNQISLDRVDIDLSDVEQIVDPGQTESIAWALRGLLDSSRPTGFRQGLSLRETVDALDQAIETHGLVALGGPDKPAFWVRPRKIDIVAALNRLRTLSLGASA
ncbi:ABC-ATPase domain-containing protein [Gleimia sp. 6138-11-ORH1]|uniref:ABC-ATPase domain-containing protein n=1 Tax=Gleimia sp. 6138-11-ORH1 TaxID=2973937 RepID=UPI002166FF4D|nr:ABC-ATPase domain-containing protein [Gleimia sp. 6138-11-ORH1]MCS4485098.1 ABC-ATPase domain-containing protein [Gleimia sp. 6138-11-ORH1]